MVVEAAECGWERPQVIYSREKKRHSDHGFSCVIRVSDYFCTREKLFIWKHNKH